jgi:hypothetical protein
MAAHRRLDQSRLYLYVDALRKRAESLAFDSAGNLFVVDAGGVSGAGNVIPNAIYKFTPQGARSTFASGQALSESFACLAFQPIPCCECGAGVDRAMNLNRPWGGSANRPRER